MFIFSFSNLFIGKFKSISKCSANVFNCVVIILPSSSKLITLIAPSLTDNSLFGITKFSSILYLIPKPLQSSHEPYGALNENNLGSNSGKLKSQSGQAYFSLIIKLSLPITSITTLPLLNLEAVSIELYNLLLIPSFIINLSIITLMRCFLFLSKLISSVKS